LFSKNNKYFKIAGNIGSSQNTGCSREKDGEDGKETVFFPFTVSVIWSKVLLE